MECDRLERRLEDLHNRRADVYWAQDRVEFERLDEEIRTLRKEAEIDVVDSRMSES